MCGILSDNQNSYNSLRKLYKEHKNENINSIRNDNSIKVEIVSIIRKSNNFDQFKVLLNEFSVPYNPPGRKNILKLKEDFFTKLSLIATNSSSYRDFKSMVELYEKILSTGKKITEGINKSFLNSQEKKSKEEWNNFYYRKFRESQNKINLNKYIKLNNTELKSLIKINGLSEYI